MDDARSYLSAGCGTALTSTCGPLRCTQDARQPTGRHGTGDGEAPQVVALAHVVDATAQEQQDIGEVFARLSVVLSLAGRAGTRASQVLVTA